jgi:hypothetical protein
MPDSVLINALFSVMDHIMPDLDATTVFVIFFMGLSIGGALYTVHALLGYQKDVVSVIFLGVPFVLIGAAGIAFPLLLSCWLNGANGDILEKAGVTALFDGRELYGETLILSLIFMTVCALYVVLSQRIINARRTKKTWLTALAFSCGQEFVMNLWILAVSIARLASGAWPTLSGFFARFYYYAAAAVLLKALELLFILVYVETFGARRRSLSRAEPDPWDRESSGFAALKRMARRQCGFLPLALIALLPLILWPFALFTVNAALLSPFLTVLCAVLALRAAWFLFPGLHPLPRSVARWGDPDRMADSFLKECGTPLFTAGAARVTANFLIDESFFIRVYYLPALVAMETEGGDCLLRFENGAIYRFPVGQGKLAEYLRHKPKKADAPAKSTIGGMK